MDVDSFFREVSEHFLGGDTTEASLIAGLRCLRRFMPADRLHLALFDPGQDHYKLIAMVTEEGAVRTNRVLPFRSDEVAVLLSRETGTGRFLGKTGDPVSRGIIRHDSKWGAYCGMSVELEYRNVRGSLSVHAVGEGRYTDEHLQLFTTLRVLFSKLISDLVQEDTLARLKSEAPEPHDLSAAGDRIVSASDIVGADAGLKHVMGMARQVSHFDSPVILLGETGVGKEMIAALIHQLSERRSGPFVPVNCGAIPETLIDSELFGHEKGAFTGATAQKKGVFELADKGTVFLDEIGEMPLNAQIRMLRVLQEKKVQRVGGTRPVDLDIRVIAATHRNLDEMIESGRFRSDLWFRLHVFTIMIPPLRERKGDIPILVEHFLEKKSKQMNIPVPLAAHAEALSPLMNYDWPGNVRELENVVERALILSRGRPLAFHSIVRGEEADALSAPSFEPGEDLSLDGVTAAHIRKVLKLTKGRINGSGGAAEKLGINPATLRNRMNRLGVPYGRGIF